MMQIDYMKISYKEDVHICCTNFVKKIERNLYETINRWKTYGKQFFSKDHEVWDVGLRPIGHSQYPSEARTYYTSKKKETFRRQPFLQYLVFISNFKVLWKQSFFIRCPPATCSMWILFHFCCKVCITNINIFFA
jgi:hypothetical protein